MIELLHGDCLELMKDIPDKSIDMILCDLPYGTTACKWDVVIPFEPLWEQYKRIIKDRGCIALFGSEPFSSHLRMSNIKDYKYDWIWEKTKAAGFLDSKKRPLKIHEVICVFCKVQSFYDPQGLIRGEFKTGRDSKNNKSDKIYGQERNHGVSNYKNYPKSIIKFSNPSNKGHSHPTQKPVPLLEYLIKTYTLEGETVLDNTMGSGSTGVACINTNRNFIGIEKDDKYFEIAKNRIEQAQQDVAPKI